MTHRHYQRNILFDRNQKEVKIRDDAFDKYYALYDVFKKNGYDIATDDINRIHSSDYVIYVDLPRKLPSSTDSHKSFVILSESPLIRPDNYDIANHKYFRKIFTHGQTNTQTRQTKTQPLITRLPRLKQNQHLYKM